MVESSTRINCKLESTLLISTTGFQLAVVDSLWNYFEVRSTGDSTIVYYINGSVVAIHNKGYANPRDTPLIPMFSYFNGSGVANKVFMDLIVVEQQREYPRRSRHRFP